MIRVPKIEIHLAHACNLRCEGCSHYANYGLSGLVQLADGGVWLQNWSKRIEPMRLSFLGGEPLLNKFVPEYLYLAREIWPHTMIRLTTNGLLLTKWGVSLWKALAETQTVLTVSIHSRDADYVAIMKEARSLALSQADAYGFRYEERNSIDNWYRLYQGSGSQMRPFEDNDPAASWHVCQNRNCVTLQDNTLWKCPPIAHLPRLLTQLGLSNSDLWAVALQWKPLTLDATDDEIREFFARKWEKVCGMCPKHLEYFEKSIY
jgi:organic radical activating enzyme